MKILAAHYGALWLGVCALAGCATFSSDGGFDSIARTTQARLGKDVRWARTDALRAMSAREVAQLLQKPLSIDDAVQIALLNNGALQASFEELGISEADLVQSGRLPNPRIALLHANGGGRYDVEETVSVNVVSLLTAPFAHAAAGRRFAAAQDRATAHIVELAARTRAAWFTAVAAEESVHYMMEVKSAAQAGAELARRMRAAGNWSRLDQDRQQGFYLDAALGLTRAQLAQSLARENLTQLLGLGDDAQALALATRLPDLPEKVEELPDVVETALATRLDLKMMRARVDATARDLKLTAATRFVDVLEAGAARVREGEGSPPVESGYVVSLEVPLFDGGSTRVRKAQALYAQSIEQLRQAAVEARSEVRKAYARYRAAHEIAARERDELLPLRKSIADENLKRYDAAQISVFDLLADARSEIGGVNEYIESVRDFWIAKSTLDTAMLANP